MDEHLAARSDYRCCAEEKNWKWFYNTGKNCVAQELQQSGIDAVMTEAEQMFSKEYGGSSVGCCDAEVMVKLR